MKKQLTVNLNTEVFKKIKIYCVKNDLKMTQVIRDYINDLLKK